MFCVHCRIIWLSIRKKFVVRTMSFIYNIDSDRETRELYHLEWKLKLLVKNSRFSQDKLEHKASSIRLNFDNSYWLP